MISKYILFSIMILLPACVIAQSVESDTLELHDHTLQEVVVQSTNDFSGSRETRQPKDLLRSTDQILNETGGLQMIKRGNFAWEPAVRGLSTGQINMTIDGMQIFGACTDKMDPVSSYIEPNNLQSIIVNYGTGDQSYGTSIGGGMNFRVKQARLSNTSEWHGLAAAGYESNGNAVNALGSIDYRSSKFGFQANGIVKRSANYFAGEHEEIRNSQYQKWNGSVAMIYRISESQQLALNYIQDEGYNIGYPGLPMDVLYAKAKIGSVFHTYTGHHTKLEKIETKFFFNTINHAMDDSKRIMEGDMKMDMPGTSLTTGFYSEGKWRFQNHSLKAKINGFQNLLHADMTMYMADGTTMYMFTLPDAQRTSIGIDISDKMRINQTFSIQYGIKGEHLRSSLRSKEAKEAFEAVTASQSVLAKGLYNAYINTNLKLRNNLLFFAGLARAMRAPTLQENYGLYLFNRLDGYDYLGNSSLQNEKSVNIDLGMIYQKERMKIRAEAFAYLISAYIAGVRQPGLDGMTSGAAGVKQYQNLPSATVFGFEVEGEVPLSRSFSFHSASNFTYGYDHEQRALPLIAPFKTINRLSHKMNGYSTEISAVYSGPQRHVNAGFYGESESEPFIVFNLRGGKSFVFDHHTLSLFFGIENLLNKNYYEHLSFMKVPSPGRNFTVHVSVGL